MAQEGSEASVASSPPAPGPPQPAPPSGGASWWRDMHHPNYSTCWPPRPSAAAPLWAHHQPQRRTSSSGADDDFSASNATMTSFTNTSGVSCMDDSSAAAAAAESHLWNQVLMGAGGEVGRTMHDGHGDDSENFLELLNSRTLAPELFAEPPACNYLKKIEYGGGHGGSAWTDNQFTAAATLQKQLTSVVDTETAGYVNALTHHHHHHAAGAAAAPERLTANLSDLVSNWSIAPPNPCHRVGSSPCDNAAVTAIVDDGARALFQLDSGGNFKHEMNSRHGAVLEAAAGTSSRQDFLRPVELGYNSMLGLSNRMYGGGDAMDMQWGSTAATDSRSLTDLISFGGATGTKSALSASPAKTSPAAEYTKQRASEISSPPAKKTSSGGGVNGSAAACEGKKKRSEEGSGSEGNVKKSKHETSSSTSSLKTQVPKVKLGEKITALQQIVSPFGKTDTASVLYEAINYIKWLHEQVQLLSDPYMKSSSSKDYNAWGGLHRKDKEDAEAEAEAEADLRSRGLCLVPVSCTPEVYRDNNGPDYWTPPYRSCLYR